MLSFFKHLFDKQSPAAAGTEPGMEFLPPAASQEESFRQLLLHHLERIANAGTTHAAFVRRFFPDDLIDQICELAKQKMALSLADGDDHNVMMGKFPVCYDITTFPMPMREVSAHLSRKFGGFLTLLRNLTSQHPIFTQQGCTVLCLLAFGRAGTQAWVNVAIVALDPEWQEVKVLPVEFLSMEERRQLQAVL